MQTPGNEFVGRCTCCGNKNGKVKVFTVRFPDRVEYVDRLCETCERSWGETLLGLGCQINPLPASALRKPRGVLAVVS